MSGASLSGRSLYAVYEEDAMVKGIPAYRFSLPREVFANSTANAGFCIPPGNCPGSGLLDVAVCKEGGGACRRPRMVARIFFI